MALITCKDCAKEFSTDAKKCPHCGARKPDFAEGLASLVVIGFLGFLAYGHFENEPENPAKQDIRERADKQAAAAMHLTYEKYKLAKSKISVARSACRITLESIAKWGAETDWLPNGTWAVTGDTITIHAHDVRLKNGFGASSYADYTCAYNMKSGSAAILNVQDY